MTPRELIELFDLLSREVDVLSGERIAHDAEIRRWAQDEAKRERAA